MKNRLFVISCFLSFLFPAILCAETAIVVTKENAIRDYCRFFAPVKAQVRYNDNLEILSTQGDWLKVRFRATEGCIHKTAVEKKTVSTGRSFLTGKNQGVSESEAALAGKGFNPQVEASYKQKHPEMRYNFVDYVEKLDGYVPEKDVARFVEGGGLRQP